jgi:hypothetical protein
MPDLRLKRDRIVPALPSTFRVVLTMPDGFRLHIGNVTEKLRRGARKKLWAWSAPGAQGQAKTRDDAAEAVRAAWLVVTDAALAALLREQGSLEETIQ